MKEELEFYKKVKAEYPEHIVLIRLGDFYEAFGEDAKVLKDLFGMVLVSRKTEEDLRCMAGFPDYQAHHYTDRLVNAGHKVVVVRPKYSPQRQIEIVGDGENDGFKA